MMMMVMKKKKKDGKGEYRKVEGNTEKRVSHSPSNFVAEGVCGYLADSLIVIFGFFGY